MVKCVKCIGILSLIAGVINAFLDPGTAGISIASGAAGLIGCLYAAILLDTLVQIKDGINEIRENTKKPQEKAKPIGSISMFTANASSTGKTGWTCKACGCKNDSTEIFCNKCGMDRY